VTISGTLIAESMRVGALLENLPLRIVRISRRDAGDVTVGQPPTWTIIEFEISDEHADALVAALSAALQATGGWYCDLRSAGETFVVFAGRVFRYPRGDATARGEAEEHARSVGVPDPQLDWPV
jgi:hypothetical protein